MHNMGHAICAYLGLYTHRDYIFEAMDDVNIQNIVMNAMLESALALSKKYQIPTENLVKHFQDLLIRFQNQALKDTCKRVGGRYETQACSGGPSDWGLEAVHGMRRVSGFYQYRNGRSGLSVYSGKWLETGGSKGKGDTSYDLRTG